ncbi:hypothetical protein B9G55_18240 [Saccharibacillus sp. O16]|nr:hypothetical protein B9G55_18240 [Saccharibacillus sp. O16]
MPSGAETYYRSQYTGVSDHFEVKLKTIDSAQPAPEESTLHIVPKREASQEEGRPARLYFEGSDRPIEGRIGQENIIQVEGIPKKMLNGLDFEATLETDVGRETVSFKREHEERRNFYPKSS